MFSSVSHATPGTPDDLVEGDESKRHAIDFDQRGLERGVEIGARAGGRDAGIGELLERLEEARLPAVEEVVGGQRGDVHAVGVTKSGEYRGVDAEDGAIVDGEVVDHRALEVVEGHVGAADERGHGTLVAGPHGIHDVEAVADEALRYRVGVDARVLRRAAPEDPVPATALGQRGERDAAVGARVAEAHERPDVARVVGLRAGHAPGDGIGLRACVGAAEEISAVDGKHLHGRYDTVRWQQPDGARRVDHLDQLVERHAARRGEGRCQVVDLAGVNHGTGRQLVERDRCRVGGVGDDHRERNLDIGDRRGGRSRGRRRRSRRHC
jgi:hypothetical protein